MSNPDSRAVHHTGSGIEHPGDAITLGARFFGWAMLTVLTVWFVNVVLKLSFGWPGALALFDGGGVLSAIEVASYLIAVAFAGWIVTRDKTVPLRADSARIHRFNLFVVRAAFFIVLFVGLGDVIVSALRVENALEGIVGSDLSRDLGRSQFRGPWLHVPLMILGVVCAFFARTLGFHWLTLMIVAAELMIVITRFVFSYEQAFMGDLVRFWYAALFLFASAYTLYEEGHVRVDIFYAGMRNRSKGRVNTFGTVLLGMGLCWTILIIGLGGPSAIIYGAVANFEVSQSGFGLYVKYMMAAFLGVFALTMLIQFVSYFMESVADWRDEPGTRLNRGDTAAH
ncbi:putative membrane protein [Ahrensia sp. R2A130]|nr:putative membrane protein [Ahrensia sp. R2A130]